MRNAVQIPPTRRVNSNARLLTHHSRRVYPAPPHPGISPWLVFSLTVTLSILAILFGMLFVILSFYAYYQYSGLIVPGVQLGNQPLSGMTFSQASLALHRAWETDLQIVVTNGTQTQSVSPSQLGFKLDAVQTAKNALDVGRGGSTIAEMAMMFASLKDGWLITAQVELDEQKGRQALQSLESAMSQPPRNATFRLEGNTLIPVPSQVGYTIDIEASLDQLRAHPQEILNTGKLQVAPKFIPPDVTDATPALSEARRLLDTPTSLYAYDPITDEHFHWPVPQERLAHWLEIHSSENGLLVSLDKTQVGAFLDELNPELAGGRFLDKARYAGEAAETIRLGGSSPIPVSHNPTEYSIQAGDTLLKIGWKLGIPYWLIVNANPGLDPDHLLAGSQLVIPSKDNLLPLPIIPNKRIIISIDAQRLSVFQDGNQIKKFLISTGIDRSPTQPGVFQVQTHENNAYASVWDLYMPNFIGIYEAWPGFMNGIHGLPTLSNGRRLWANILGKPASYGCIILGLDDADWLYHWAENGVVVEIQP